MIYILCGNSGAGKTFQIQNLKKSLDIFEVITYTTRKKRPLEVEDVDYYYITIEEFKELEKNGDVIAPTSYVGNYYGVPANILEKYTGDEDCILDVDLPGIVEIKERFGSSVVVICLYLTKDVMERRMRERGDSEDKIEHRLKYILPYEEYSDYVIDGNRNREEITLELIEIINR